MQKWPRVEEELVKRLESLYPLMDYQGEMTSEQFTREAARRDGQREVVNKLRLIYESQMRG